MSERNPFDQQPKGARESQEASRDLRCEEWESLLADALDGLLPATDSAVFTAHSGTCAMCAQLLAEAKQGQAWLQFLHVEPEMPHDLVERIVSKTSGAVAERPLAVYGAPIPAGANVLGMPPRRMVWDTRMMMTAAMAFFSIALTLNLVGVRITDLRLSSFTPASMENSLTRQFYGAKTQMVRYYDNLRFVYEVESKMRELRRDEDTTPPAAQPKQDEKPASQSNPSNPPANGHKTGGKLEAIPTVPKPDVMWGHPTLASTENLCGDPRVCTGNPESGNSDEVETLVVRELDQAERSLA
jgi:hypothetical protein